MEKKAQIKMIENIGVLMMFFVIIVISIIFYMAFQRGSIEEQVSEYTVRNAVELSGRIGLLPELQCRKNNVQEDFCYDLFKLNSAKLLLSNPDYTDQYFRLLGYSTIKIKIIYPTLHNQNFPNSNNFEIYNYIKPDFINNDTFSVPVSIYEPDTKKYYYGVLEVNVYG